MSTNPPQIKFKQALLGKQYVNWFYSLTGKKPKWYPTHVNLDGKRVWATTPQLF